MNKYFTNSSFIGKKVIYLSRCQSTNDILFDLWNNRTANMGDLVITDDQTAGKGQRGSSWQSTPHHNLAFSFLLCPNIPIAQGFVISQAVALALVYALEDMDFEAQVKWPNDIYINNKKVAGVLIQNQMNQTSIHHSIVGIGLNVNQEEWGDLEHASSLALLSGKKYDTAQVFENLIQYLNQTLQLNVAPIIKNIPRQYEQKMMGMGEKRQFTALHELENGPKEGEIFTATVKGVAEDGALLLNWNGVELRYYLKQVKWHIADGAAVGR